MAIEAEPTGLPTMNILASEAGIDYTQLHDLLAASNWREADQENYRVMIRAVGKEMGDYFTMDALLNLPCTDLNTIDQLWVTYSKGHFGFSVQKEIYVECGAQLDGNYPGDNIWDQFCDRVGWKIQGDYVSYSNLKANPSTAPKGELPGGMGDGLVGGWGWIVAAILSKLADCEIRSF